MRIVFLLLLGLLPFLPYLFGGVLYSSDQSAAPAWHWFFDALRSGQFPLWDPYSLGGMPTWDAMFGDAFYPPFLLLGALLPAERLPVAHFLLHTWAAGLGAYLLARRTLPSPWALTLGAAYMLHANFISLVLAGHTGKFAVIALLPWAVLYFRRAGLLLSILVLMLLTSHLQMVYFVLSGLLLYALHQRRLLHFLAIAGLALALTAAFWLPPIFYNLTASVRGDEAHSAYAHAASWSLHWDDLLGLISPHLQGIQDQYRGPNPFKINSESPGIMLLWGAGFALWRFRDRTSFLLAALAGLVLLFALGDHTPIHRLLYYLFPWTHSFRAPSMLMFWFAFILWALSARAATLIPARWAWPVLAIVLLEFGSNHHYFFKATAPSFPPDPVALFLQSQPKPFRVYAVNNALPQGWGEYWGVETLNGFKDQEMKSFRAIKDSLLDGAYQATDGSVAGSPLLNILDVKWIVYRDSTGSLRLAKYTSSKGRGWIEGGTAIRTAWTYNRQTWEIESPGGILHLSELYFPHWAAAIDGRPEETHNIRPIIGLHVPAGRHTVTLAYQSIWIRAGVIISSIAMVISVSLFLHASRWKFWPRLGTVVMFIVKHGRLP